MQVTQLINLLNGCSLMIMEYIYIVGCVYQLLWTPAKSLIFLEICNKTFKHLSEKIQI